MRSSKAEVVTAVLGWALLVTSVAPQARAEARDTAAATELFSKGRAAMKQQDFATACAAFADSQRFDPKVGTLLNLADCEEHLGHLVSARSHWQQAIDLAHSGSDSRESIARQRFGAVDPRVAKLSVKLAPDAPADAAVKRDDVDLGPGSLGVALPVDPGAHIIVVTADGYDGKTTTVSLTDGEVSEILVGPGAKHPPPPPPPPPAAPGPPPSSWSTQKTLAIVSTGLAAAGVAVGTTFGFMAKSANSASLANGACDANNGCLPAGLSNRDDAVRDGNVSTIAFVAGGAFLATGVVLWIIAPSRSHAEARPSASMWTVPGGAVLGGLF
jgi:hypothetical protein